MGTDYGKLAQLTQNVEQARSELMSHFVELACIGAGPSYSIRASGVLEEVVVRYGPIEVVRVPFAEVLVNPYKCLVRLTSRIEVHKRQLKEAQDGT